MSFAPSKRVSLYLLAGSVLAEQHDEWKASPRYFSAESTALIDEPKEVEQAPMLAAS